MSYHHYPPYPCCGGLTFHKGGKACDEHRYPSDKPAMPLLQPSIFDLVIVDMRTRESKGIVTYGDTLRREAPIDTLQYAYEEALDLAVYLRKAIAERDGK